MQPLQSTLAATFSITKRDRTTCVKQEPAEESIFLELLRPLLEQDRFDIGASEFLSGFARQLGCTRASLGLIDDDTIKVCAVSWLTPLLTWPTVRKIAAAMEECILQETTLAYPVTSSDFPHVHFAHAELTRITGAASVLTIPLAHNGVLIGAVTLESSEPQVVCMDDLGLIELLVSHAGPLLKLKWSLGRPFAARCKAAVRRVLTGSSRASRRMILVAAAMFGLCAAVLPNPARQQTSSLGVLAAQAVDGSVKNSFLRVQ